MNFKEILTQLNIIAQCRRYGIPLWQCPQFLFLVMGIIIIVTAVTVYAIGTRYVAGPEMISLVVLIISAILFVIANIITQSFERLSEANRMKSDFVDIVSHQLRSPLTSLRWAVDLLMSGELGKIQEKQTEYFKILKENSTRMEELVSDLLIVSRIETAKLPLKKKEFSMENLVRDLISKFKLFAKASNVEISFEAQENLPKSFSDPSRIRLVIENFLDNAIKYIKDKGKVEIKLLKKDENIYFEIRDNGVGIPAEDQKYIFQKFFRSGNVMRLQTQGSGLGLYISKAVIEKTGGKIGFKSKEGKGTTFWFTLPIK